MEDDIVAFAPTNLFYLRIAPLIHSILFHGNAVLSLTFLSAIFFRRDAADAAVSACLSKIVLRNSYFATK